MSEIKLFVPLGTQKFPFERIIVALNELVDSGEYGAEEIVMQAASYPMTPKFRHFGLIRSEDFDRYMKDAGVVVTHGGVNSILTCMNLGKPLVVCPRKHEYGEHVDDHQMEIARLMRDKYDVLVCTDMKDLPMMIEQAKVHEYKQWTSHRNELLCAISKLIV